MLLNRKARLGRVLSRLPAAALDGRLRMRQVKAMYAHRIDWRRRQPWKTASHIIQDTLSYLYSDERYLLSLRVVGNS